MTSVMLSGSGLRADSALPRRTRSAYVPFQPLTCCTSVVVDLDRFQGTEYLVSVFFSFLGGGSEIVSGPSCVGIFQIGGRTQERSVQVRTFVFTILALGLRHIPISKSQIKSLIAESIARVIVFSAHSSLTPEM